MWSVRFKCTGELDAILGLRCPVIWSVHQVHRWTGCNSGFKMPCDLAVHRASQFCVSTQYVISSLQVHRWTGCNSGFTQAYQQFTEELQVKKVHVWSLTLRSYRILYVTKACRGLTLGTPVWKRWTLCSELGITMNIFSLKKWPFFGAPFN